MLGADISEPTCQTRFRSPMRMWCCLAIGFLVGVPLFITAGIKGWNLSVFFVALMFVLASFAASFFVISVFMTVVMRSKWSEVIQRMNSPDSEAGTAWSFRPSSRRWAAHRKAEWGCCGRSMCFALRWCILLELGVAVCCTAFMYAVALWKGSIDVAPTGSLIMAIIFCGLTVCGRFALLALSIRSYFILLPPTVCLCGTGAFAVHFLSLRFNVNCCVDIVSRPDGKALLFQHAGADPTLAEFYSFSVPVDDDFDLARMEALGWCPRVA